MRMKNPFSRGAGDEPADGDDQSRDSLNPPAGDDDNDPAPASETEVSETRADDAPAKDENVTSAASDKGDGSEENIVAPSIGPNTKIDLKPPGERLDHDKISDKDAMGRDKRREVVGGSYGPSRTRVFATFATFFAVVAALGVGFYFLAKELDQPPAEQADEAPWAQVDAPQAPPKPLQ
ncbi:MAG: hypothetical protein ACR2OC_07280 [Solirubrobacterales bacterium]